MNYDGPERRHSPDNGPEQRHLDQRVAEHVRSVDGRLQDIALDYKGRISRLESDNENLKKYSHDCNKAPWAKWILGALAILFVANIGTMLWMMSVSTDVVRVRDDMRAAIPLAIDATLKASDRASRLEGLVTRNSAEIETLKARGGGR